MAHLVLGRQRGEEIVIVMGDKEVVITPDRQVRLMIDAPIEIPVHRREVYDRLQAERKAAQ